jgi:hydroxyacylglutathione hydrolase
MIIEQITVTAFQQHTRIVGCEQTRQAICIDPGDDSESIVRAIDRHGFQLQAIACTHAHLDHIGGVADLKQRKPEASVFLHQADERIYDELPEQPAWIGVPRAQWAGLGFEFEQPPKVDQYWQDGQIYEVGQLRFTIIHCPGHTPGHVIMFEPNERKVFVGDVLFAGSIGRTDLPGGDSRQIAESIQRKQMVGDVPLPEKVRWHIIGHLQRNKVRRKHCGGPRGAGVV